MVLNYKEYCLVCVHVCTCVSTIHSVIAIEWQALSLIFIVTTVSIIPLSLDSQQNETSQALSCRHASPRTPLLCFCRHSVRRGGGGGELALAFQHLPRPGPFQIHCLSFSCSACTVGGGDEGT